MTPISLLAYITLTSTVSGQNGIAQFVQIHQAIGPRPQDSHATTRSGQAIGGVEHGLVLGGHGHDVAAASHPRQSPRP